MIRIPAILVLCGCLVLLAACSKQEPPAATAAEESVEPVAGPEQGSPSSQKEEFGGEDYSGLIQNLARMQSVARGEGETLLTGDGLVFDYDRRYVRMDGHVVVQDGYGTLEAGTLIGHFSASNQVEYVEAGKHVVIRSEGREASAEAATYNHGTGEVVLSGQAQAFEGGNRLAGEQIQLWLKGERKVVCEPDALLSISAGSPLSLEGGMVDEGMTEVRSDRMVYDENELLVRFEGHVRVRDPRVAMNCDQLLLNLKENSEIDWIEARSGVIIQLEDRKALSDRANYYADDGKFVLEGDPKVMQERNIMTGERIVFWHDSSRMICEPNARVLLYPDEELKAKFLQDLKD